MSTVQEPQIRGNISGPGSTNNPAPGSAAVVAGQPLPRYAGAVQAPAEAAAQTAARVAAHPAVPPQPDGPAGDLLLCYLREQFLAMLQEDPRVRAQEADAVHKMRVSTRRMRSALASYRRFLAPDPAREVRAELKWLAGLLGAARDVQVLRVRLQDLVAVPPVELVIGPVQQHLDAELRGDYRSAHAVAVQALNGPRYLRLLEQLESLLATAGLTTEAGEPAGETVRRLLKRDRRRLHQQVRAARAASGEIQRAESLHEARKGAKRLRYAAEVAQPVHAHGWSKLISGAERVQKILGEHQDSVVSREYLLRFGAAASAAGENGFTYGLLYALEEQRGEAARKRFRRAWSGFPRVA